MSKFENTVPLVGMSPARPSPPPCSRSLDVGDWSGGTDTGRVRQINEDAWGQLDGRAFVVADGMGGRSGGRLASRTAIASMMRAFAGGVSGRDWIGTVEQVNLDVAVATSARGHTRAGTTMVAAVVSSDQATVINVGDSRIYRLRSGGLDRLTRDHNLREELLAAGQPTARGSSSMPLGALTSYLGGRGVDVELANTTLMAGDRYLLCTDGVHGQVPEHEIASGLATGSCQSAVQHLLASANAAGGRDNATVVVVEIDQRVS